MAIGTAISCSIPVVGFNAVLMSEHFGAFFAFIVLHVALLVQYVRRMLSPKHFLVLATAVVVGALAMVFGLFSPLFTGAMLATPPAFIATLAGLAMLRVLQTAFGTAFEGRFALGALVTFLVTVADIAVLSVGAAFWGLLAGFAVSWLLERPART